MAPNQLWVFYNITAAIAVIFGKNQNSICILSMFNNVLAIFINETSFLIYVLLEISTVISRNIWLGFYSVTVS